MLGLKTSPRCRPAAGEAERGNLDRMNNAAKWRCADCVGDDSCFTPASSTSCEVRSPLLPYLLPATMSALSWQHIYEVPPPPSLSPRPDCRHKTEVEHKLKPTLVDDVAAQLSPAQNVVPWPSCLIPLDIWIFRGGVICETPQVLLKWSDAAPGF